jgi:hypothetical protein
MLKKVIALAAIVGSIGLGEHALACPDRANEAIVRSDSILSKYKQIFRERKAVMEGLTPRDIPQVCSLTRELAELEREWLDSHSIIKNTCPSFYSYSINSGSNALDPSMFETNYELSQKIIDFCAQKGM